MSCNFICSSCRKRLLQSGSTYKIPYCDAKVSRPPQVLRLVNSQATYPRRSKIHSRSVTTGASKPIDRNAKSSNDPSLLGQIPLQSSVLRIPASETATSPGKVRLHPNFNANAKRTRATPPPLQSADIEDCIKKIWDPQTSAQTAWHLLRSLPKRVILHDSFSPTTTLVLQKVLASWSQGQPTESTLSPVKALKLLYGRGVQITAENWRRVLLCSLRESVRHFGQDQDILHSTNPRQARAELVSAWRLASNLNEPDITSNDHRLSISEVVGTRLSAESEQRGADSFETQFYRAFAIDRAKGVEGCSTLCLASYALLKEYCQRSDADNAEVRQYNWFIDYVDKLFASSGQIGPIEPHERYLSSIPGFSVDTVQLLFKLLPTSDGDLISKLSGISYLNLGTPEAYKDTDSTTSPSLTKLSIYIETAVSKADVHAVEELWQKSSVTADGDSVVLPSESYLSFIQAYASLNRPNRAVDVWNHVVKSGIVPTLSMWDSLLKGFGTVRDVQGVEYVWNVLVKSGIELDARIWTTRIWSLKSRSRTNLAFEAFEGMVKTWLNAFKDTYKRSPHSSDLLTTGNLPKAPKPTVEVLNALIAAITGPRSESQLNQAVKWAVSLGIRPDVYTFNGMIRLAIKQENPQLMNAALQQMQKFQVKMDIATYTMLVQSVFKDYSSEAADEEESIDEQRKMEAVTQILEDIRTSGLRPNAYTFSTVISGLLKTKVVESGHLKAANQVVALMRTKHIPLSSQIYTSFVTAHFAREPEPDLDAVVQTWQDADNDKAVILDEVFYDRLIEGFAKYNDIRRMRLALAAAGKNSRVPGWLALTEAIAAFSRAGDNNSIQEIIEEVKREERDLDRLRKGKGKKWFWDTVRHLGFADDQDSSHSDLRASKQSIYA